MIKKLFITVSALIIIVTTYYMGMRMGRSLTAKGFSEELVEVKDTFKEYMLEHPSKFTCYYQDRSNLVWCITKVNVPEDKSNLILK